MNLLELGGNIVGGVVNFGIQNSIGAAATIATGYLGWRLFEYCWDKFKPLQPMVDYLKESAYNKGVRTRSFLIRRVSDTRVREKIIEEAILSSESIQDSFVDGISGR